MFLPLAFISFAAPALLAGAIFLALPVIAHWMHRRVQSRAVFPSLILISEVATHHSHLGAWRRWLLFMLRCLAVLLAVAAFAHPFLRRGTVASDKMNSRSQVVVLLDTSASMGRAPGGVPLFHEALRKANEIAAAAIARGDRVQLIAVDAHPEKLLPEFTSNPQVIAAVLKEIAVSGDRAHWASAFAMAHREWSDMSKGGELVVLSDFQASNWEEESLATTGEAWKNVRISAIPVSTPPSALTGLTSPSVSPSYASAGQPVRLAVRLINHSSDPRRIPLTTRVNGFVLQRDDILLEPHTEREWVIEHHFDEPGAHRVEWEIPPDEFPGDDYAFLVCRVLPRPPVVVVSDADPDAPGSTSYFLTRALSPRQNERDIFAARTLRGGDVSDASILDARAIWVADAPVLDPTALSALVAFAERGGTLFWLMEGEESLRVHAALRSLQNAPWLPMAPESTQTTRDDEPFLLEEATHALPLLASFDVPARDALGKMPILRRVTLRSDHPETREALRFRDGAPALVYRDTDAGGRVVQWAFSASTSHGPMGSSPLWVALCHAMMDAAPTPHSDHPPTMVGGSMMLTTSNVETSAGTPHVITPDGLTASHATFFREGTTLTATLPQAKKAGFYELRQRETVLAREAANTDPREGVPALMSDAEIRTLAQKWSARATVASPKANVANLLGAYETPMWGWALLALLLALGCESLLLARWRF